MQEFYKWRYESMDWEATINKQIETKRKNKDKSNIGQNLLLYGLYIPVSPDFGGNSEFV